MQTVLRIKRNIQNNILLLQRNGTGKVKPSSRYAGWLHRVNNLQLHLGKMDHKRVQGSKTDVLRTQP